MAVRRIRSPLFDAFEKLAAYVLSVTYGIRPEEGLHTGRPGDGQFDGFKKLEGAGMPDSMAVAHTRAFRSAMEAFHAGKQFDSDRYFDVLWAGGLPVKQARAVAEALASFFEDLEATRLPRSRFRN